jgi:hypothetical protein
MTFGIAVVQPISRRPGEHEANISNLVHLPPWREAAE